MVQYFVPEKGIQVKLHDMHVIPSETSESQLSKQLIMYNLNEMSADNTICNFGGARRLGKSNTFVKLQSCLNRNDLLGLGCNTHMLHNAMQTVSDCLPVDEQHIVFKIYQYFSIYNVRVESLKNFCEFAEVEYKKY